MAIFVVFLAAGIGFVTSTYAFLAGHVGILGAAGLYVSVGWATIIAVCLSNVVVCGLRKANRLVSHEIHDPQVIVTKSPSLRRKSGM